jgi:hypothetical protein
MERTAIRWSFIPYFFQAYSIMYFKTSQILSNIHALNVIRISNPTVPVIKDRVEIMILVLSNDFIFQWKWRFQIM